MKVYWGTTCGYGGSNTYYATTQTDQLGTPLSNGYSCSQWQRPVAFPYPNPAGTTATLPAMRSGIQVLNSQGQVMPGKWDASTEAGTILDVNALPNGLYLVVGRDAAGQVVRQRLQVQH